MWLHKDTKKSLSLKRLIQQGFDVSMVIPEKLDDACLVAFGVSRGAYNWLLALESLAAEEDSSIVEEQLSLLINEQKPL
jgi:hypothetical protein